MGEFANTESANNETPRVHWGAELLSHRGEIYWDLGDSQSPKVLKTLQFLHLRTHLSYLSIPAAPRRHQPFGGVSPFSFRYSGGCAVVACFGFNLHFLMINIKYLCPCLLTTQCSLLWNALFCCLPFSYWFFGIYVCQCTQILYVHLYLSIQILHRLNKIWVLCWT